MPEKTQKKKLRSDQSTSQIDEEIASLTNDENVLLSDRDFEDISSKVENRLSKRLRETEVNQREILKLIGNLSSKVDNLTSVNPGQNFSTLETEIGGNPYDELEEVEPARSVNSNMVTGVINEPMTSNNTHARSSSLPPPNQRQSDEIIDKLLWNLSTQLTNKHQIFPAYQKPWQQRCQRLTVRQKNSSYSKTCFKLA